MLGLEEANSKTEGQDLLTVPLRIDPDTLNESLFIDSFLVGQTKNKLNKIKTYFCQCIKQRSVNAAWMNIDQVHEKLKYRPECKVIRLHENHVELLC